MQDAGGGGGFAVDTGAVRAAGAMLSQLDAQLAAGPSYGVISGLGEARAMVDAAEGFRTAADAGWRRWHESLAQFARDVTESGRLIGDTDAAQAGSWAALGGQMR